MFQELDKNGDGRLDAGEMRAALSRAGIDITPATVTDLVRFLVSGAEQKGARAGQTSASPSASASAGSTATAGTTGTAGTAGMTGTKSKGDMYITFPEFRDFLIMLPREATPFEIYKCESAFLASCRASTDCDQPVRVRFRRYLKADARMEQVSQVWPSVRSMRISRETSVRRMAPLDGDAREGTDRSEGQMAGACFNWGPGRIRRSLWATGDHRCGTSLAGDGRGAGRGTAGATGYEYYASEGGLARIVHVTV
jgi:hypothetical protein